MDNQVKSALAASLEKYASLSGVEFSELKEQLINVFNTESGFMDKVAAFDAVMDDYPSFESLREVFFDLLMINFFSSDVNKLEEDYLDSQEWADIEEDTIDRGTELLNLLLYIVECRDEQIKPELGDFLKEFLLVEEDEFQDEFHIYESLISNQQLVESSVEDICNHADLSDVGEELQDLFVPFMAFFYEPRADVQVYKDLEEYSNNKEFDIAVYALITNFNKKD